MYKIYCDDLCIYDPSNENISTAVVSPKLSVSDNTAGSLKFTMPITNVGYGKYSIFKSNVEVYNDDKIMWRGRIITDAEDFNRSRAIECEGALAFLNDTIQPARLATIQSIIDTHNSRVSADRQFKMGVIDIASESMYVVEYQTTYEALSKIVENLGWHMRVRCVGEDLYLDILRDYLGSNAQTIEFGINLLDFTSTFDVTDLTTVIIPRGKSTKAEDDLVATYVTIESVNNGSIYLESPELVALYGTVEKTVDWPNINQPQNLLSLAQAYLSDYQFDGLVLEASVLDLHILNPEMTSIGLLDMVHCVSAPHGMDRYFPVTKMEIDLSNPAGTTITLNKEKGAPMSEQASDIGDEIDDKITRVEEKIDNIEVPDPKTILDQAKADARDLISSATGGYVTMVMDDSGDHVEELVISNTQDWTQADQYWRWNLNGLGYFDSSDPQGLKVAMTMDGQIVADLITVGTMSADRIQGGTLELGNYNGQPGRIFMYDGKGKEIGSWSESGITAAKGVFKGALESGNLENANGQGIRISNGIIQGWADGTAQGYIDTGRQVNGDHDNYLGRGFRIANRVAILLKTPILGTWEEFSDIDEGGLYDTGATGSITITANMGASADGLTYQTKTLNFKNGLLVTSLEDPSGGSTGGGASSEASMSLRRMDFMNVNVGNANVGNAGVLDHSFTPDGESKYYARITTIAPLPEGESSRRYPNYNMGYLTGPGSRYSLTYTYKTETKTILADYGPYIGPIIVPLCSTAVGFSAYGGIYFVGVHRKTGTDPDRGWVVSEPFGETKTEKHYQRATFVWSNNNEAQVFNDSLAWKDEPLYKFIDEVMADEELKNNMYTIRPLNVFKQRLRENAPDDGLVDGMSRQNTNVWGMPNPLYPMGFSNTDACWAMAYDEINGERSYHLLFVGDEVFNRTPVYPQGANAPLPAQYDANSAITCQYAFYWLAEKSGNASDVIMHRPRRYKPTEYLIPMYKDKGSLVEPAGKVMSKSNIYVLGSKEDADELVARFTSRTYETQESIEADFQDRLLYWHNPQNREACAQYAVTTLSGQYPIY